MRRYRELHISGALLDKNQLANYMEKLASSHNVKNSSSSNTYPIPMLKENFSKILETYNLLNKHIKLGIKIHSAGEWLLDNFYIIEENVKAIEKDLTLKKYKNMVGLANGKYEGFARAYVLSAEIVGFTEGKIDSETIDIVLKAYQKKKLLGMEEIWSIGVFIKIALISQIREICEKIYSSQVQKYRAESIIERIIEKKEGKNRIFINSNSINIGLDEPKYSFIEYMSYKLKKYGKNAIEYQNVLEKEVSKLGLTVSDVIQKEHFYIANLKIVIGNCIKSIKEISGINFGELFSYINGTEEILRLDPAGIYNLMDEESKSCYRGIIEKISKKNKISEIYVAEKLIELARRFEKYNNLLEQKKSHIGYYLVDEGIKELEEVIEGKFKIKLTKLQKAKIYVSGNILITLYIDFILTMKLYFKIPNLIICILFSLLTYIPISEIVIKTVNYILSKITKPKIIPKMDYEEKIPKEAATIVVIPTILKTGQKVKEMLHKLEVYYLANKLDNIYFALLGDCSEEDKQETEFDEEIMKVGITETAKLNQKYGENKFFFLYRKRRWNECEGAYIGWERKRGLLSTFNLYIKNKIENNFAVNTIENFKSELPNFKYVITLDSDTNLSLGSAGKLIGAMEHILNKPVIENRRVISGYGIAQPRIGLDLGLSKKSLFIELYSMQGGVDFYTNAISDVYQDYFGEGIFTGKGIYNIDVYNEILDGEIPENLVLSHDLLEGNFLRCALLTDIILLDGFPSGYMPYIMRNHRWTRGDVQIVNWLKSKRLKLLDKFKIFDNLRRNLISILSFVLILLAVMALQFNKFLAKDLCIISIFSTIISYILDLINYVIYKESNIEGAVYADKKFSNDKNNIFVSFIRILFSIAFLPYEAYKNIDAIIRSLYRKKNNCKMLEWVTAEDGEKNKISDLNSYYYEMKINSFFGIFFIFIGNFWIKILGVLWLIAPICAWYISLENEVEYEWEDEDKEYLEKIAKQTWDFFETYINEDNNYLMIDNYQEDREKKIVNRTSSTNIGLEILAVISAYDLGFINYKKAISLIRNIVNTINNLSKWNGHLYNWYKTETLEPLIPRYISSVDSGNFIGYLYVLKQFLIENKNKQDVGNLIQNISNLIDNTDFSYLYSPKNKLLSVGFNLEENKLTDSYYDFLASEARQASLVAIAKRDIPAKHWHNLSRTLTSLNKYKGLVSWSGTAFEYLMPNINLKRYKGSLLDESSKFAIMSQIEYCKNLDIPWGISESAFNLKDLNNNFQYKAFGIPWLGFKRGLENDFVISPYSTFLSLEDSHKLGIENLRWLEYEGLTGKYGFYEAVDYTKSRLKDNNEKEIVKTYMAHHQGLILLSINNIINNNILKKRFNKNPEIEAVDVLLQEKMPMNMIITKEKKEKITNFNEAKDYGYAERTILKENPYIRDVHVISNENYKITIDEFGEGKSEYNGILINNYKETNEIKQGIFFYIKNIKNKRIIRAAEKSSVTFAPDKVIFSKQDGNLKLDLYITIDPDKAIEIRRLEIENMGNSEEIFEVVSEFEPIISNAMQEYAHPAFNKLFLKIDVENDNLIVQRNFNRTGNKMYLGASLYTEDEQIGDFEYEIDKEKYYGKSNFDTPIMIENNKHFSKEDKTVLEKVVAMKRTIKIAAKEKAKVSLIMNISEDREEVLKNLEELKSEEEIVKTFELSRARSEEELKYLQIKSNKLLDYQNLLKYVIKPNYLKKYRYSNNYRINDLWKFGISGDFPIIFAKIKNLEDIYVIEDLIDAFEYYRAKKILIDLVILNEESNVYEKYVRENIEELISNKQIQFLINRSGGIFLLDKNNLEKEDFEMLEFKARVVIDAGRGGISTLLKEYNEKLIQIETDNVFRKIENLPKENNSIKEENKVYSNKFGDFSENGKEYNLVIDKKNRLPAVWCNILANRFFGAVVTENLGGYVWNRNSRLNRLTAWNNNSLLDLPSEIFYIKDEDENYTWTLNNNINPNSSKYYITHGFGYTKLKNTVDNLIQELEIFVPLKDSLKINKFTLKNNLPRKRKFKLVYYVKTVLGEDEIKTNGNLSVQKLGNIVTVKNLVTDDIFKDNIMYVSSNLKIKSYTGEKENFFKGSNIKFPNALFESLNNKSGLGKNSCLGIEFEIDLNSYEEKEFYIILGEEATEENILKQVKLFSNNDYIKNELQLVKNEWKDTLNVLNIKTPLKNVDILVNGWLPYQTISSRIWGKTGYYQSGGAFGFRDQLQDCIGMKFIDEEFLRKQIINCASHQFMEGDVLHWWHEDTKKGIRTKISDDLLWLVYAVIEYVEFTGDIDFLNEEVEYLKGDLLQDEEDEKYSVYYKSDVKESVFNHCKRSINKVIKSGIERFPKIGTGDWNDGFNKLGEKGQGESIWLGFFLYDILNRFIPICEKMGEIEISNKYNDVKEKLKRNLNTIGWDGRWYKRAITDDGEIIGGMDSKECRIDSISQSWSVISNAGDNDKKFIAIENAENYLVDRENKMIKLFDPPFEKSEINPGYIKDYLPGVRENGGQYTHASCWLIIAEAMLGFGEKAVELCELISPINHTKTQEDAKKFKLEPYIIPADIYSAKGLEGRGGWNWYTGAASWYYTAIIEYIVGFKIKNGYIIINPCVPKEWKEFEIKYKYQTSNYIIKIKNKNSKNTGVEKVFIDGVDIENKKIPLENNGKIYNIEIYM